MSSNPLCHLPRSRPSNLCFRKYLTVVSANFFIVFSDLTMPRPSTMSSYCSFGSSRLSLSYRQSPSFPCPMNRKTSGACDHAHRLAALTQPPTASRVRRFLFTLFQALNRSKKPNEHANNGDRWCLAGAPTGLFVIFQIVLLGGYQLIVFHFRESVDDMRTQARIDVLGSHGTTCRSIVG